MPAAPELATARLVLRPLTVDDAPALYPVYSDPRAMEHWHTPAHASVEETRDQIAQDLAPGADIWAVWHPADQRAIGVVGYLGNTSAPGLGYIFHPDYWGQGYATEAVSAALAHGFATRGLDRVELWITDANRASQRLAGRLGFTLRGRFRQRYGHRAASHEMRVYGLHAAEWRAGAAAGSTPPPCYRLEPILAVPDVRAAAEWYRDMLEFSLDWLYGDPPTHGAVSLAQWTTEGARIQLTANTAGNTEAAADPPGTASGTALYLFAGPDLDARYARYAARGVEVVREPADYPWGMREFAVRDLNGYLLRFGVPG